MSTVAVTRHSCHTKPSHRPASTDHLAQPGCVLPSRRGRLRTLIVLARCMIHQRHMREFLGIKIQLVGDTSAPLHVRHATQIAAEHALMKGKTWPKATRTHFMRLTLTRGTELHAKAVVGPWSRVPSPSLREGRPLLFRRNRQSGVPAVRRPTAGNVP